MKMKELSNFPNSNMSLNKRFQMKTVMSCANAADSASYSQIFSKLALCQRAILGEWVLVRRCQIKKRYTNISLLKNLTDHYIHCSEQRFEIHFLVVSF